MASDILKHLSKGFNEEIERYELELGKGMAKDYGAYQNVCGIIHGLRIANNKVAELHERLTQGEDDDD